MSLEIVNAKNYAIRDEEIWMLAEIEIHPKVLEWDTDVHTEILDDMYSIFKTFFKKLPDNEDQIFLIGKLGQRAVGFLGIHRESKRMKHVGVVGVTIHPDFWNMGFGTELLRAGIELAKREGYLRLEAYTLVRNKAMIRIAEKNGFSVEGIRKLRIEIDGRYLDEALLGKILK